MRRTRVLTGLFALSCLFVAFPALAAKGTVRQKPPDPGVPGTIIVTDPTSSIEIEVGDLIPFTEATPATEGDLVEFDVIPSPFGIPSAGNLRNIVAGTRITGVQEEVEVGPLDDGGRKIH